MLQPSTLAASLRPIMPGDHRYLQELYAHTRAAELALVPWDEAQKAAFIEMQYTAQQRHYAAHYPNAQHSLVLLEDRPAGQIQVSREAGCIRLVDLIVAPEFQQRGLGTALLRGLQSEAASAGLPLRLSAYKYHQPVVDWYTRLGFSVIEDTGMYLVMEWQPGKPQGGA